MHKKILSILDLLSFTSIHPSVHPVPILLHSTMYHEPCRTYQDLTDTSRTSSRILSKAFRHQTVSLSKASQSIPFHLTRLFSMQTHSAQLFLVKICNKHPRVFLVIFRVKNLVTQKYSSDAIL